jgi:type IV fimbrial biogenesis protein FimT
MNTKSGFTLVELMITLAIVAIVATVAVPAWSDFVRQNRVATVNNELITAFGLARSEAARDNSTVSVCPSTDQSSCTGGTDWTVGWVVYTGSGQPSGGSIIHVWDPLPGGLTLDGPSSALTFSGDGSLDGSSSFDLQASSCHGQEHRDITVLASGQSYTEEASCV